MKIILIFNEKGGVGKSSLNFHLGTMLKGNKKNLLIDLDPQGTLSKRFKAFESIIGETTYDVAEDFNLGMIRLLEDNLNIKTIIQKTTIEGIDIISSNKKSVNVNDEIDRLMDRAGISISSINKIMQSIRNKLKKVQDEYDHIFIDVAPSIDSKLNKIAIASADEIIIPVIPSQSSIEAIKEYQEKIENIKIDYNPTLKIKGVVVNSFSEGTNNDKAFLEMIKESEFKLLGTIRHTTKIKEAEKLCKPIFKYANKSDNILKDYKNIANKLK